MIQNSFTDLGVRSVSNIIQRGGTILKSARCQKFHEKEFRAVAYNNLKNKGVDGLIAIGGDGTLNEVVNGFVDKIDAPSLYTKDSTGWLTRHDDTLDLINPDAVLGLIPIGTGGDFRRTLGWMGTWKDAVEHLGGRDTMDIDLGQLGYVNHEGELEGRLFLNIASAGISGDVDARVNKAWKGLGGQASFIYGLLT